MAKYTTTIKKLNDANFAFFDYPYDLPEGQKTEFEALFLDHYMFHEIGFETPAMFKHYLKNRLQMIATRYRKLYETEMLVIDVVNNYDMTETQERVVTGLNKSESASDTTSRNIYRDTPQGRIENVELYATDVTDDNNVSTTNNEATSNQSETFTLRRKGNIGVNTQSDMIRVYRNTLLDVHKQMIEECSDLFMQIY